MPNFVRPLAKKTKDYLLINLVVLAPNSLFGPSGKKYLKFLLNLAVTIVKTVTVQ